MKKYILTPNNFNGCEVGAIVIPYEDVYNMQPYENNLLHQKGFEYEVYFVGEEKILIYTNKDTKRGFPIYSFWDPEQFEERFYKKQR